MRRQLVVPLVSGHNTLVLIAGRRGMNYQWAMETQSWLDLGAVLFKSLLFKNIPLLETRTRQAPFQSKCREFIQLESHSGETIAWVGVSVKEGKENAMMLFIEETVSSEAFVQYLHCVGLGNTPQDKKILGAYFSIDARHVSDQEKLIIWYLVLQSPTGLNLNDLMEERLGFLDKYQREPLRYVISQFTSCYQHEHLSDTDKALCMSSIHKLLRRFEQKKAIELDVNRMPELHILRRASSWDKQLQKRAPQYELYYIWVGAISLIVILLGLICMLLAALFWSSTSQVLSLLILLFTGAGMVFVGIWALGLALDSDLRLIGCSKLNLIFLLERPGGIKEAQSAG